MATLRFSPAPIRTFPFSPPISASLHRSRFSPLKSSYPRRRLSAGGSAAGATMSDSPSSSYASALAEVAKSNNALDATMADIDIIQTLFSNPSIKSFFANPTFSDDKKLDVVQEIAVSSELQPHTANFLNILVEMKRVDLIEEIAAEFERRCDEITGTEVAAVSSVVALDSQQLSQIAKAVQRLTGAKNVRVKTSFDSSLVAGFTIRFGNSGSKLIDMSVRKQLDEIAAQMEFATVVIG